MIVSIPGNTSDLLNEMTYFTLVLVGFYVTLAWDGDWLLLTFNADYVRLLLGIKSWY